MAKGIDKNGVCKLIADTKKAKGYTNARLSELSGVPKFTVGAYVKAARTPSLQNLQKLCPALGLDAEQVTRDYGYYPEPRKKKIVVEKPVVEAKEEDTTMPVNTTVDAAVVAVKKNDAKSEYKNSRTGVDKAHKEMFGKWLATLIVKSGFSQVEYGELIEITDRVIYNYCRGITMPTLLTLQKICKLHNVDWKVAACYFGYKDYKVPSYWLGDDYKANEDWNAIDNIVKADYGVTTNSLRRAIERQTLKKDAPVPTVDLSEYYTNRIAELERQLEEAKKETASALADAHDIKKEYEGRWEVKLANIRKELEGKYNARIEELEASNANLQADLAKAPTTTKADMYVVAVENHLKDLLPKAKTVGVSCTSGELYWDVELPGVANEFNGEITAEDFAQAIHKNVTEAAMTAIGLN